MKVDYETWNALVRRTDLSEPEYHLFSWVVTAVCGKKPLNQSYSKVEYTWVEGNSIKENMVIGFYRRLLYSVKLFPTYFSMICIDTTLESLVKLYSMKTKSLGWGGDDLTLTASWTRPVYLLTPQNVEALQSLVTRTQGVHPTCVTETWFS